VRNALAQAARYPHANPWYRAVCAGGEPAGFVMVSWDVEPQPPEIIGPWFLWKLLIDQRHQGRGYGAEAVWQVAGLVRAEGAISLGYGPDGKRIRRKVSGKTKQEVRAKLQALHQELNSGVRSSSTYTLREAIDDWLREGLDGTSDRTRTLYESPRPGYQLSGIVVRQAC